MHINPLTAIDFYKADHRRQYPEGTTEVYSNFTPRSSRIGGKLFQEFDNKIIFFGLQYFLKNFLIESWNKEFFQKEKKQVIDRYKRRMDQSLGKGLINIEHISDLHDLGYLPLKIKALEEGSLVPIGVPVLTLVNTLPEFFWLTNYLETILSCYLWKPITSATTAFQYRKLLTQYAVKTGSPLNDVSFQAHDFSFRGMSSLQDAVISGAAHLTSFWGTDTVPAIDLLEDYYDASSIKSPIGVSVPATEHSVMCMGEKNHELDTFKRLIKTTYPKGIVSIVSDTWDFWQVIGDFLPLLKDDILSRDGKVVIRPDSGDPIKIVCGDPMAAAGSLQQKGAIEALWDIFGGTITANGYKLLDPHIGLIYGDSITHERARKIVEILYNKGFCSTNIVFGIGSFTYQYVTRDNFGFAMKATSGVVNGQRRDIFKDPKTDNGVKKSAKGLLRVEKENDEYTLYDQQTPEQEEQGELKCVFLNGKITQPTTLDIIREKIDNNIDEITRIGENNEREELPQ